MVRTNVVTIHRCVEGYFITENQIGQVIIIILDPVQHVNSKLLALCLVFRLQRLNGLEWCGLECLVLVTLYELTL